MPTCNPLPPPLSAENADNSDCLGLGKDMHLSGQGEKWLTAHLWVLFEFCIMGICFVSGYVDERKIPQQNMISRINGIR
jgi:hypothetical protein